jgi:flagellar basal body-associated protein FliL
MAEKAEKKPESSAPPAPAPSSEKKDAKGGMLTKLPVLVGGVMLIEAVVLFAGFKFIGGAPRAAAGAEIAAPASESHGEGAEGEHGAKPAAPTDKKKPVELSVVDFRAPNKISGRTFLYDVSIVLETRGEFEEKVKNTIKDREALIKDRIRTIIAQSDPEKLGGGSEPGLETLRRQVKHQLDEIVGEGIIDEVLVPKCIPFRTDF